MTEGADRAAILQRQEKDWLNELVGARLGNPYAGMCRHCSGKHRPPNDELCPHLNPKGEKSRMGSPTND